MQPDLSAVRSASAAYRKPADFKPTYGTAGFRTDASLLPSTVFRCGLLIGLKALSTGQVIGPVLFELRLFACN
jgi:phosphoacetylglucosamine mutase